MTAQRTASDNERAIVIGSGFGGAVTACRLSQAGFDTLILERGRRYEAGDFPALPPPEALLPDGRRLGWEPDQGLCDVQDLEEIISVQAAGYGGGSLIYANVQLRPPAGLFEQVDKLERRVWPAVHSRAALEPFYNLVAHMLDAAPITTHRDGSQLVKTEQLRRAAQQLGREAAFIYPPIAVSRRTGTNAHGQEQGACRQCGACVSGCPHRAKNTLDFNYLAVAEKRGARVRTLCEVIRIERVGGVFRVHSINHVTAQRHCDEAELLFLCAGAVHSTRLLAAAELALPPAQAQALRARIGLGYYPNADAVGVVFETENPQYPSWGPTITGTTVFSGVSPGNDPNRDWFMIQDGGYAHELDRMIGLLRSPLWAGRNRFPKPDTAATVPACTNEPEVVPEPKGAPALVSMLDRLLQAQASGLVEKATPKQLEKVAPELIDAVGDYLLPPIVGNTIERSIRAKLKPYESWIGRDSWVVRCFLRLGKWVTCALGGEQAIARHAARSVLTFGGQAQPALVTNLGYTSDKAAERTMLLAMGPDPVPGVLHYHPSSQRLTADLDLYHLAPRYQEQELAMRDIARSLNGELRVNPAWAFLGKPITVHSQGGCRMSDSEDLGVTDPNGQVWNCPGLYVVDGACLPASVGANPSSTIAAIAERNVLEVINRRRPGWLQSDGPGAVEYRAQKEAALAWKAHADKEDWKLQPPLPPPVPFQSPPIGLAFNEFMQGFHSVPRERLRTVNLGALSQAYRDLESAGRPYDPIDVKLTARVLNLARFFEDQTHKLDVVGTIRARLPGDDQVRDYPMKGSLELMVPRHKKYVLSPSTAEIQRKIAGSYRSSSAPKRKTRLMRYTLGFKDVQGEEWQLHGFKHLSDESGPDALRDATTLFIKLVRASDKPSQLPRSAGAVHVDMPGFVDQMRSLRLVTDTEDPAPNPDPARVAWTLLSFGQFFFGNLQRIYLPEMQTLLSTLMRPPWSRK